MNFKASCLSALVNWHWLSSFSPLSWTYFVSRRQAFLPIFPSPQKLLLCCPFIQDIITGSKKADYKWNYFWHSQSTGIFGFSWICPIFATRGAWETYRFIDQRRIIFSADKNFGEFTYGPKYMVNKPFRLWCCFFRDFCLIVQRFRTVLFYLSFYFHLKWLLFFLAIGANVFSQHI